MIVSKLAVAAALALSSLSSAKEPSLRRPTAEVVASDVGEGRDKKGKPQFVARLIADVILPI